MRLTLRTLLAYMDDRLPPAGAREIGLKISQSPFAGELLERIREVKRRRRIATAAADRPTVDANLIAEYLDDQLSPDLVQRIEQKVLASDPLLAEVASAHELLGLLRDPIELEPKLRDRLYGLDPTGVADVLRAAGRSALTEATTTSPGWQPESPRSAPSRHWPALTVAALGLIWLLSLVADPSLFRTPATGKEPPLPALAAADQADNVPGTEPPPQPDPMDAAIADARPQAPDSATVAANPADAPAARPVDDAPAVPDMPDMPAEAAEVNALPPAPKAVYLQAESRIVLVASQQTGQWTNLLQIRGGDAVVPALNAVNCRPLLGSNWVGIPRTFNAGFRGAGQAWQAKTNAGGILRIPESNADLQLLTGQLILTTDSEQAWPEGQPPVLALQMGSDLLAITLMTEQTRVAVEADPSATPSLASTDAQAADAQAIDGQAAAALNEQPAAAPSFLLPFDTDIRVRLTVVEGSAQIAFANAGDPMTLGVSETISWLIVGGKERSQVERSKLTTAGIPPWMLQADAAPFPELQAVQDRVLDALSAPGVPGELVQPLLTDRNPQVGIAAADVLCVTADTNLLLSGLFEGLDEAVHRRIIDGLRAAVNGSATARQSVSGSLETRLSMADAAFAMQLISGLNDTLARDRLMTSRLLQYLQGDSLALRTLSIFEMERLTGGRQNYFPAADASRRRDAVNRWQKAIDRNGGTLLP